MKIFARSLFAVLALALGSTSWGQAGPFTKYGPVAGIQKSTGLTYNNTAAASADVLSLWSGSCSVSNFLRGDGTCAVPAGTGVTSVGLTTPSWYTVTGSPVTGAGTLAITATAGQTAKSFLATPTGSTGAVSLRTIALGDLPTINVAGGGTGVVTLTNHGVLLGQGTSNVSAVAAMGADTLLQGQAGADPAAVSVNNCGSSTTALSYSTSTHTFGCQTISVGGTGTVTNVATSTGLTGGPITTTGTLSVDQTAALTWSGIESFAGATNTSSVGSTRVVPGIRATFPAMQFTASVGAANNRIVEIISTDTLFSMRHFDDAFTTNKDFFNVTTSGNTISGIQLGNTTDRPAVTIPGGLTLVGGSTPLTCPTATSSNGAVVCVAPVTTGHTAWSLAVSPTGGAGNELGVIIDGGTTSNSTDTLFRVDGGGTSNNFTVRGDGALLGGGGVLMTPFDNTFTLTYNGFSAGNSLTARYYRIGNVVTLIIPGSAVATSNATTFTATGLPSIIQPATAQVLGMFSALCEDNGTIGGFTCSAAISGGTITFAKNNANGGWTASGQKGITTNMTVSYIVN